MDDALRKLVQSVHVIRGLHRGPGGRDAIPVGDPQRKHRSIGGGSFAGKKNPDAKTLARVANKFIYHSGTIDDVDNMKWGLEPQHGDWIRELANHAGDIEPEELLQQSTPLVWMSDKPSWVAMKVARKLKKHPNDVTDDEISQHGHVAMVPRKGEHAEHIWHVGEKGLDNGEYSPVTNLKGETKKAGWTDLYQNDWSGNKSPFGVEKNEYVSAQPVEPMFHLTGQDLVDFLHHTGTRKSATGNNGNFNPHDPDITKAKGGAIPIGDPRKEGFKLPKIKPSTDNPNEVGAANFDHYDVAGHSLAPIESLSGGVNLSHPDQRSRVDVLKQKISHPTEGHISRILADDEGNVLEGQHRLEALRELGATHVPITTIKNKAKNIDFPALHNAIRGEGGIMSDHVGQIARMAIDSAHESGSPTKAKEEWEAPRGFETRWHSALNELERQHGITKAEGGDVEGVPHPAHAVHGVHVGSNVTFTGAL